MNMLLFSVVWEVAPITINLLSFGAFLFVAKGKLTVATAFTSIALLDSLRGPLGRREWPRLRCDYSLAN